MTSNFHLAGKCAVVTGGGSGLGRTIALALATAGASVAVVARRREALDATVAEIKKNGGTAHFVCANIADPEAVSTLKQEVENSLGVPQILVNAAGTFGPIALIKDGDAAAWLHTLAVNVAGPYLTSRAFVGGMIDAGWGRIINVTSAAALHPPGALNSAYATSKVALNQFTRNLAAEVAGTGVTANVFHPGDVRTEMWADIRDKAKALGPPGSAFLRWVNWVDESGGDSPHKAADLVLRLTSDSEGAVNGQFLWIEDGLQSPVPSWEDRADESPWK